MWLHLEVAGVGVCLDKGLECVCLVPFGNICLGQVVVTHCPANCIVGVADSRLRIFYRGISIRIKISFEQGVIYLADTTVVRAGAYLGKPLSY